MNDISGLWQRRNSSASDIYYFTDPEKGFTVRAEYSESKLRTANSISFIDYRRHETATEKSSCRIKLSSPAMPESPDIESGITYSDSRMTMTFVRRDIRRLLLITAPYLRLPSGETGLKCDITLQEEDNLKNKVHETEDGTEKSAVIIPMEAEGRIFTGDRIEALGIDSTGLFEWRRTYGKGAALKSLTAAAISSEQPLPLGILMNENGISSIRKEGGVREYGKCSFTFPDDPLSAEWQIKEENGKMQFRMSPCALLCTGNGDEVYGVFSGTIADGSMETEIKEAYGFIRMPAKEKGK